MCNLHQNLRPSSASKFPKSQDVKKLKMKMMMRHTPPSIYTRRGAMLASIFAEKNSSSEEKRRNWKSRRARVEHNFVHNRRDVWWCTTSRKDKHKPFEVWGWAAVLDSFSDQRCCAASGRRGFQQQMVYVFVRENNQPTRTMGSKPRFRIWYLCLI